MNRGGIVLPRDLNPDSKVNLMHSRSQAAHKRNEAVRANFEQLARHMPTYFVASKDYAKLAERLASIGKEMHEGTDRGSCV